MGQADCLTDRRLQTAAPAAPATGHRMGAQPEPQPHVRNINQNHIGTAQNEESKQKLRTQSALEKRH